MWDPAPDRENTSEAGDAARITASALSAGEAGIVMLIGGIVLGGILAGATLLFCSLRGHKDDALVP